MKPVWLLLSSPSFSSSAPSVASSRQYQRPLPALPIPEEESRRELQLSKRKLSLSLLLAFPCTPISIFFSVPSKAISDEDKQLALERYTDTSEGFTLLIPSSWIKVEKAGATVLFEQVNKGINNVGVVVTPVRLNSLGEFGTPQFVADKLIQAEKRKESTKNAEVIGVAERSGHGGLQVYEFEYKLDSTRGGLKRIFSAAFVASKRLYLLNIAYSDRPESPLDTSTKMMLEQVLHSFDVILQGGVEMTFQARHISIAASESFWAALRRPSRRDIYRQQHPNLIGILRYFGFLCSRVVTLPK